MPAKKQPPNTQRAVALAVVLFFLLLLMVLGSRRSSGGTATSRFTLTLPSFFTSPEPAVEPEPAPKARPSELPQRGGSNENSTDETSGDGSTGGPSITGTGKNGDTGKNSGGNSAGGNAGSVAAGTLPDSREQPRSSTGTQQNDRAGLVLPAVPVPPVLSGTAGNGASGNVRTTIYVEAAVPQTVALRIDLRAEISFEQLPGEYFIAAITELDPPVSRIRRVRLRLTRPDERIRTGMNASVRFIIAGETLIFDNGTARVQ
ncbi:MAG: efflux RND transporter periplasmic adaptor subunit [Spirochaetaceae bacterium]|jgi:hypothetical protein|nr:efflux RND transporter periplasmic adaptor subunit [Spirochaetaceae bacterium]